MKQVAQNYRTGELCLLDVPAPACRPGGVLVRTRASLISAGTELMKIGESRLSLVGKARARPDHVQKVVQSVSQQGLAATYRKVSQQLDSFTPLGYSLCGTVVEVGKGVTELEAGQRVACAGDGYAFHAELNWVPRNLCVAVPDAMSDEHAAYATVGAIALHGYRRSEATLGETACVIGLGLVGQLLVQVLTAGGVHVVGLDPSPERCRLAERGGALACLPPGGGSVDVLGARLVEAGAVGGVDHVFLAAGGDTNEPVEVAAALARDRARLVVIGRTRLDLPWKDFYAKELEVRFSRSYGPGRYDAAYEEGGADYPAAYVRWTEQRNMAAFLALAEAGRVDLDAITSAVVPFDEAVATYHRMRSGDINGVGVLFRYADSPGPEGRSAPRPVPGSRPGRTPVPRRPVHLGVVGAGRYASSMLLPHLARQADVVLVEVATATGLSARNAQRRFGFSRCSTDWEGLLAADDIDAVLIATRHHLHGPMTAAALRAGKTVFVEKPLAINDGELDELTAAVVGSGNDRVMVGFNRRFAPLLVNLRRRWAGSAGPVQLRYDVNAGRLDPASWYARRDEAGSRLVGEACHFVDVASWWLAADPIEVVARGAGDDPDNVVCTFTYPDGSLATVSYLTGGDGRYPKEVLTVFGQGRVARLQNFERAELWIGGHRRVERSWRGIDKGQRQQLEAFVAAVATGGPMPIPFSSLVATTAATLAAQCSARTGRAEAVRARANGAAAPHTEGASG